jgi:hypothetical protein
MKHRSFVLLTMLLAGGVLLAPGAFGAKQQLPTMGKHLCSLLGGVWTQKKSTCEISSSGSLSRSFTLTNGQTLLVDKGVTLNISPATQVLDLAGPQFGFVNNGTVNNVGTISNDGTADGAVINNGTFNNSGSVAFASRNDGQLVNQGAFNNSGSVVSWNLTNNGTLSNTFNLTVDQNLQVGAGGMLDNSGSISAQWKTSVARGGSIRNESGGTFISLNGASPSFDNHGSLSNLGQFTNYGPLVNEADGALTNGASGSLGNYNAIDNFGAVTNGGAINDWCGSTFTNESGSSYSGTPVIPPSC